MRSDNIAPHEWRWVAAFSTFLVTLTLLPFAWALLASDAEYQFMGILFNPKDGATYLSKIQQGVDGNWLFELRHTPQSHERAGLHTFYLLLGHIARLLGLSNVLVFHLARVAASFFMFYALYVLGAAIWQRERPRRWFFMLISAGSGLGWLGLLFQKDALAPDLTVPEAFPLLAAYTNPHFPLAIGCMALLTAHMVEAFRPGFQDAPTSDNGGLMMMILSVILAIISPPALLVIGGVLVAYTLVRAVITRAIPFHEARWTAMVVLTAFPFAAYYYAVFRFNDIMREFNDQNVTKSPNVLLFLLGYGLLLVVAIPGLVRAVRRFEPDGDQLMLIWVVINSLAVYTPFFGLQRRLFIGLIIPIVYFAVRALGDYWFSLKANGRERIPEKWRLPALIALAVFILPSHALTFGAPLAFAVFDREGGVRNGILLDSDYLNAFRWMDAHSRSDEVVLAAPVIGLWIPAETHLRPVYGHEFETVPAEERLEQVRDFYRGEDCVGVFDPALPFVVKFVLWGPREDEMGIPDAEEDNINAQISREEFEDGETIPEERLPEADKCKTEMAEQAAETRRFGDVMLYVLDARETSSR